MANEEITADDDLPPERPLPSPHAAKNCDLDIFKHYYDRLKSDRSKILELYDESVEASYQSTTSNLEMERYTGIVELSNHIEQFRTIKNIDIEHNYFFPKAEEEIQWYVVGFLEFSNGEKHKFSQEFTLRRHMNEEFKIVSDTFNYLPNVQNSNDGDEDIGALEQAVSRISIDNTIGSYVGCGFSNPPAPELDKGPWSCYINATIQVLLHTPSFLQILVDDADHRNEMPNCHCLFCELFAIFNRTKQMQIDDFIEHNFRHKINDISSLLVPGDQDGAPLFLGCLLEKMTHSFQSRFAQQTPSVIDSLFNGIETETSKCLKCLNKQQSSRPFSILTLSLHENPQNIKQAIEKHTNTQQPNNCANCQDTTNWRIVRTWQSLPKLLCLELERFSIDRKSSRDNVITVRQNNSVSPSKFIELIDQNGQKQKYKLVSLASHTGATLAAGHYTATADVNGTFYKYDDRTVSIVQQMPTDSNLLMYQQTNESANDDENVSEVNVPLNFSDFDDDFSIDTASVPQQQPQRTAQPSPQRVTKPKKTTVAKTTTKLTKRNQSSNKINVLPERRYTIKCGLDSLCKSKELKAVLLEAVENLTKILKLGALHVHCVVYEAIVKNDEKILKEIFGGAKIRLHRLFWEVTEFEYSQHPEAIKFRKIRAAKKPKKKGYRFDTFTSLMRKMHVKRILRNRLSKMIDYAEEQYIVSLHCNMKLHGKKFLKSACKLVQTNEPINNTDIDSTIGWLYDDIESRNFNKPNEELVEHLKLIMGLQKSLKKGIFQELANEKKWHAWVPAFIRMQLEISKREDQSKSIRNYKVLPIFSYGEKCLALDSRALMSLYNLAHPDDKFVLPCDDKKGDGLTMERKEEVWSKCFNLGKVRPGKSKFGYFARVNSACVNLSMVKDSTFKPRPVPKSTKDYPKSNEQVAHDIQHKLKTKQIDAFAGADLGAKHAMGVVEVDKVNQTETNFLLSNEMWQKWTRANHFDRKLKKVNHKYLAYVKTEQAMLLRNNGEIPSDRSSKYQTFAKHKLKVFLKENQLNFGRKLSRLRFETYKQKQKALAQLTRYIRGASNRTILFFVGHSPITANSPVKGYRRLPLKAMLKHLQDGNHILVYYIDEFRTTMNCSFCFQKQVISPSPDRFARCINCRNANLVLPPAMRWRTSRKSKSWFHRSAEQALAVVKQRVFNRDITSARAILTLGLNEVLHQNRPIEFIRGAKRHQQPASDAPPAKRKRK